MSRADLRFLLKVVAIVVLLVAGGVVALVKAASGDVALDCGSLGGAGELYPALSVTGHPSPAVCELSSESGDRVEVRVSRKKPASGCPGAADGCVTAVEGAGTPGSNGAEARVAVRAGEVWALVSARLSGGTYTRASEHSPVEGWVLGELAVLGKAALKAVS